MLEQTLPKRTSKTATWWRQICAVLAFAPLVFCSVILTNAIGTETKGSALVEGANFYQCDLLFDLLKFGILRRLKTPYDYVGVLTPAMAARFAIHANAATERVGDLGNRLDVHSMGLDGIVSQEHPRQWLPVLALPGIEIQNGVAGNSLLSQAFNVRERAQALAALWSSRERAADLAPT